MAKRAFVLAALVDRSRQGTDSGARYFLIFRLADGLQVSRLYLPEAHKVARGIIVPDVFVSTLASALDK